MKNTFTKRILSLLLVITIAISTMAISAVSVSAATKTYKITIKSAGHYGVSCDFFKYKIYGTKGHTEFTLGMSSLSTVTKKIQCEDLGELTSIYVDQYTGCDGLYVNYIDIEELNGKSTRFYGGRWIDDGAQVKLTLKDKILKLAVKTGDMDYSGTDRDVLINLHDRNNHSTGEINLSSLHPKSNAFETGDKATFYVNVPDNFGEVSKIDIKTSDDFDDWYLDYIDVTFDGKTKRFNSYDWVYIEDPLKETDILYKVTVKTSDISTAGTDCNVYLHAYNENGKEIKKNVNMGIVEGFQLETDGDSFERGDEDVLYIVSPEKISTIKMYISEKSITTGRDWHVDYIMLEQLSGDTVVEKVKYNYVKWVNYLCLTEPTSRIVLK